MAATVTTPESSTSDPRFCTLADAACFDRSLAETLVRDDPSIVEARNSIGETAFHYLVVEDDLPPVEWLLRHGSDVNTQNEFGATPLMEAAMLGYLGMCRFLLTHGADIRLLDKNGASALAHAANGVDPRDDRSDLLQMLLDRLEPGENINELFDEVSAHMVFRERRPVTELLEVRGLKDPWVEEFAPAKDA